MMLQEHAYCLAIENSQAKYFLNKNIQKTRLVFDELTRIFNHLLALACHALDVGSMSSIFWLFEERENIMEVFEEISGARMHTALYRPIYKNKILKFNLFKKILYFLTKLPISINELNSLLLNNKIWKSRLQNIGLIAP